MLTLMLTIGGINMLIYLVGHSLRPWKSPPAPPPSQWETSPQAEITDRGSFTVLIEIHTFVTQYGHIYYIHVYTYIYNEKIHEGFNHLNRWRLSNLWDLGVIKTLCKFSCKWTVFHGDVDLTKANLNVNPSLLTPKFDSS